MTPPLSHAKLQPFDLNGKTLVFLGDSITDLGTLPLVFVQSLRAAGKTPPRCVNVGICGNRACDMLARLDRDVLPYKPDYLTLSAGVNDANTGISPEDFARDVTAILDRMQAVSTKVISLTPTPNISANAAKAKPLLDAYLETMHCLAAERGLRIAEVNRDMQIDLDKGGKPLEEDGVHLTFEGYQVMGRALLDSIGFPKVQVITGLAPAPLPGLVTPWKLRTAPTEAPLDEATVLTLQPDAIWKTVHLPVPAPHDSWWFDQARQHGYAIELEKIIGEAKRYQGLAEITSATHRQAYLNTGATLETVWVNGHKVFQVTVYTGWHPGKERIQVTLNPGVNRLVIETGSSFFVSLTDSKDW